MKTKLLGALLLFIVSNVNSQTQSEYEVVAAANQIYYVPDDFDSLPITFAKYEEDIKILESGGPFNNAVLNKYFSDKITNYAINTGDLSFKDYFVNANTSERSLTIGGSFRLDNFKKSKGKRKAARQLESLRKVENLLTLYIRSDLSNGFSNLYTENSETQEYNFNSNIGIGGKYTFVWNGNVTTYNRKYIDSTRTKFIQKEIELTISKYDDKAFKKDVFLEKLSDIDGDIEIDKKIIRKKHKEFYEAIVDKELEYAKEYNFIKSSHVCWYSVEFYLPLSRKVITSSLDNISTNKNKFSNWETKLQFNYLYNRYNTWFIKDFSVKATLQFSAFNTNDFIANNNRAVTFQSIIQNNMSTQVEGTSSSIFLGDYNDFPAGSGKIALSSLFFNNTVGLSGALEQTVGEIHNRNWKIGIPVSLKDNDEKPILNFELQWREVNSQHSIGISVGYNFGKFVQ